MITPKRDLRVIRFAKLDVRLIVQHFKTIEPLSIGIERGSIGESLTMCVGPHFSLIGRNGILRFCAQ